VTTQNTLLNPSSFDGPFCVNAPASRAAGWRRLPDLRVHDVKLAFDRSSRTTSRSRTTWRRHRSLHGVRYRQNARFGKAGSSGRPHAQCPLRHVQRVDPVRTRPALGVPKRCSATRCSLYAGCEVPRVAHVPRDGSSAARISSARDRTSATGTPEPLSPRARRTTGAGATKSIQLIEPGTVGCVPERARPASSKRIRIGPPPARRPQCV
jgi:hypothetical protein